MAEECGLTISNIFHAGDGNMHPIILFDARRPGDLEKAKAAGREILRHCIAVGGTITGEHGVGMEKNELMAELFGPETIELLRAFKMLFDPAGRFNPGKILPTDRRSAEIRAGPDAGRFLSSKSSGRCGAPQAVQGDVARREDQFGVRPGGSCR